MKSLPSYWRGTVFRSRTEARWAVFFDAINLRWEYESEGFVLPSGPYLPDFWLPEMQMWAEVKPDVVLEVERDKARELVAGSMRACMILAGAPWPKAFDVYWPAVEPDLVPSHFSDRYTLDRVDGYPRLYSCSDDVDAESEERIAQAMETARRMDLKAPDAGDYLPLGWDGIEVVV